MQNQIVCSGCRNFLMHPAGATNVCCAVCSAVTAVPPPPPPPGMDMSQLVCGGCRTLLVHTRGAASVRCSCCHTVNLTPASNLAHVNCGSCCTTLMFPHGATCVKCALCQFITDVNVGNPMLQIPMHRPNELPSPAVLSNSQGRTVVVENPMSVNRNGQLVSNVVVGVTTDRN